MAKGDTFTNALLGALVTIFATPIIPLAPVLGGIVSGYLQGEDRNEGLKVGTLAGVLALIPLVVVLVIVGNFLVLFMTTAGHGFVPLLGGIGLLALLFLLVSLLVYVVLASAVGGWIGAYLNGESDIDI